MFRAQWRIGSIRGIPIRVDASWLLIFFLVTWSVGRTVLPQAYPWWPEVVHWSLAVLASILFFASVLAHEVAHSLVALWRGLPVRTITLYVFGGVSQMGDEPKEAGTEFLVAVVGPATSLALGGILLLADLALSGASEQAAALARLLGRINVSLGLFNLIPGFPLDGGRVVRSLLWGLRKDLDWATRLSTRAGQLVALLFIISGIVRAFSGAWLDGLWLTFIGLFLDNAARASYGQITLRRLLDGHTVSEVMSDICLTVPPHLTLDVFVENYLVGAGRRCALVGTGDEVLGLLTVHGVRQLPRERWRDTRVAQAMTPLDALRTVSPDTPLWDALRNMTEEGVNQLPVLADGRLVGMVTRENLVSFLHTQSALGS